jgi:hypothetical protein
MAARALADGRTAGNEPVFDSQLTDNRSRSIAAVVHFSCSLFAIDG